MKTMTRKWFGTGVLTLGLLLAAIPAAAKNSRTIKLDHAIVMQGDICPPAGIRWSGRLIALRQPCNSCGTASYSSPRRVESSSATKCLTATLSYTKRCRTGPCPSLRFASPAPTKFWCSITDRERRGVSFAGRLGGHNP